MPNDILNQMTKGITEGVMARKADKATKLTPVKGESGTTVGELAAARIPDVPGVFLTNEALRDIAIDLRGQASALLGVADGLDTITNLTSMKGNAATTVISVEVATKAAERAADAKHAPSEQEKFDANIAAQAAAAQAATFASMDAGIDVHVRTEEPVAPKSKPWECPVHGDIAVVSIGKSGRKACDLCDEVSPA